MTQDHVRRCPDCGQALRFPTNVGGVLMACPQCGHRFASPFKLAETGQPTAAAPPRPAETADTAAPRPPSKPPLSGNTLAARVAARYASKS